MIRTGGIPSVDVSNVLSETKKQQVIALGRLGWPLRRIQEETGVRRETAGAYLKAAGVAIRPPGAWGRRPPAKPAKEVAPDPAAAAGPPSLPDHNRPEVSNPAKAVTPDPAIAIESPSQPNIPADSSRTGASKPAKEVTPDSWPPQPARNTTASTCEPHKDFVEVSLVKGRNAKAIWQDLVDDHGFRGSYQSVKRFIRKLQSRPATEARVVIVTPPGEEAQVDYGTGPMVRDPLTGRYRRTRLFVMTLGWSRKSVHLLTFQSSARTWAELHERAFRRLGCAPRVLILDNLAEGVLKPDVYDPALNPVYRDLLAHYGAVALPCRVRDPDRKGKVESSVGHAKRTPLKGMRFESLDEAQTYLDRWENHWADTRIHGTTKRQVAAMFAEEKPALLELPVEPFRFYQFGERVVHMDGCVEVEAAYYGAPPGWIGRRVKVQWDHRLVRLLDPRTGQLLREHLRQPRGGHRILPQDQSARTPLPIHQLLARCEKAGAHVGTICRQMYHEQGAVAVRRIQGILSLARKHGPVPTDSACAVALEAGAHSNPYRFVRRYLERQLHGLPSLRQVDPIIRQLSLYRDLIAGKTQENPS